MARTSHVRAYVDRALEHLRQEHARHPERPLGPALDRLLRESFRRVLAAQCGGAR
jgi:hypothetical protein